MIMQMVFLLDHKPCVNRVVTQHVIMATDHKKYIMSNPLNNHFYLRYTELLKHLCQREPLLLDIRHICMYVD